MPMGSPEAHMKITILAVLIGVLCGHSTYAQTQHKREIFSSYNRAFVNLSLPYFEFLDDVFGQFAKFCENITANCRRDTKKFLDLMQEENAPALKIADSIGKPESGILEGGIFFLGYYSECVGATIEVNKNEGFSGKYCLINSDNTKNIEDFPEILREKINSTISVLSICIPSSCSKEELNSALNASLEKRFKGFQLLVKDCYTKDNGFKEDTFAHVGLGLLCIYILIILIGTFYESLLPHCSLLRGNKSRSSNLSQENLVTTREKGSSGTIRRVVHEILCAISLQNNGSKLLSLDCRNDIQVLHGLRFFSMIFIILGHTFTFGMLYLVIRNKNNNQDALKPFFAQVFANGTFYVDTFYFISGLLSAYSILHRLQSKPSMNWLCQWGNMVVHRYIRLTPPMAALIMMCALYLRYIGAGPNWLYSIEMYDSWCRKNWWLNLLYMHNFWHLNEMCLSHSWYLATEMQIFVIVPPLIFLMYRNIRYGLLVIFGIFLASTLFVAITTYIRNYPPIPFVTGQTPPAILNEYYAAIYMQGYARCGPYLIGILVGYYILYKKELCLKKCVLTWLWIGSISLILAVIYLMWPANLGELPSATEAAAYGSLARSAWGLGLSWLVIACFYGYGGWANTILSWPPLRPLNRITYCAYLIHPVIMNAYYGSIETFVDFTLINMIYIFLGNVCLTYLFSFILSILFEAPFLSLQKCCEKMKK